MKDDTSTPTSDGSSPNEFERDKPGTSDRSRAEAAIEDLRRRGGVFVNAVRATRMPMVLTDPTLSGNPIVFANEAFLKLSGYSMPEVLGQQPHFLNGPGTDSHDAARFEEAIRSDQDDIVETVQYRRNGARFIATVLLSAFKDDQGRVLNHFMSWLDVTRRVEAEDELVSQRAMQATLSDELSNARILQDLAARLVSEDNIQTIYEEVLSAAIEITGARAGTVQMLDPATGDCVILASRGFSQRTSDYFARVDASSNTSCGVALRSGDRSYFNFDPGGAEESDRLHVEDGVLSAQSTPLLTRSGKPIGMVSTHWGEADHRLSERELRFLDLLARQAADLLEQRAADKALRESERHAKTLLAELRHRVRNTLAVVRSIARRTADRSKDIEDHYAHFEGRLNAFARVQSAFTRSTSGGVELRAIVEDELLAVATREGDQLLIEGPTVWLKSKPAESVSLAIHELATNAVKYGALAERTGRIEVHWQRDPKEIRLEWTESGLAQPPSAVHEGFGLELLRRTLPYDLDAETSFEFTDGGVRFTLRLPVGPEVLAE